MAGTAIHDERQVANRKKKPERRTRRVEFVVTESWYDTFEAEADSWGMDLSTYIRTACEEKRRREHPGTAPPDD